MSIELVPLGTMTADLRRPHYLPKTPVGDRLVYEVESGAITGERLSGKMKGSSTADWLVIGPDGTATLDVRSVLETDDGALIFIHYTGRTDVSGGPGSSPMYAAPLFETGDDRYRWLNKVQAVAKGRLDGMTLTYELFEVR
ncbi:DUF3237 domain-containing protein [Lentzea tibetensis]|uniref:DUF3237 domain-containing protein n=1 Tax=Lentzea tibetensis TaxID=2591470 RepID=A0A563EXR4_9PSEU|nr:DUF3237 domain-containing protein [Lentzea tibetensis]TWP52271.1 DUF3237 domain-containing protein [Lentzea tibetensis]